MVRRASFVAVLLVSLLLPAEGASPPVRRFPFWAASDGKGTVSLFWLPLGGQWPAGGYRLERVSRGRATVLAGSIRPGQDARSMMELDPANADAIRALADKIERGTLSDDERSRSISVLGRAASADVLLGRALGVRYTDVPGGVRGKLVYRLTALGADGGTGTAMESAEVDPGKATPAPARPVGLRAEEQTKGVALFWMDPPASPVAPVVGYRVDRGDGGKRMASLNGKPLLLDRHLRRGEPEFLDGAAPPKKLTYQVRSVDVFGRMSAPVRVGIAVTNVARAEGSPGAEAKAPGAAAPATPVSSARIATAAAGPAGARTESARGDPRISMPEPTEDRLSRAASGGRSTPGSIASAAAPATAPEAGRGGSSPRIPVPPADPRPAPAPEAPAAAVWTAAKSEPTARQVGPPPPPVIVGISGMADRVVVRFRPGEPEALTQTFLVVRSESPNGTGVAVGRPIPADAREWQDTTVSAGQFFWYRLVAVDGAGNRSEPSAPKWVSTGSR